MDLLLAGIVKAFPEGHPIVNRILSVNNDSYTVQALCDCPIGHKIEKERELMRCIIKIMAEEKIALPNGTIPVVNFE
jgi:hypothetical protein